MKLSEYLREQYDMDYAELWEKDITFRGNIVDGYIQYCLNRGIDRDWL